MLALMVLLTTAAAPPGGWEQTGKNEHCVVYNRTKEGSDIKEVLAIGTFDAPLAKVHAVLDDLANYQDFMPYAKETRIVKRDDAKGIVWTYERINAPLVSERDYTIRVTHEAVPAKGGGQPGVKHIWQLDNTVGPKPIDGVVRVPVVDGYWLLEPDAKNANRTKGTYYLYTSPGGSLPTFVVNGANNTAVPGVFEAIKKRLASTR